MSTQAENCIELLRGNNPESIKRFVKQLKSSVRNELLEAFHCDNIDDLAYTLGY